MISRKPKELVPAREQLQALTSEELTEVSGGGQSHHGHGRHEGHGGHDEHRRRHWRRHRH